MKKVIPLVITAFVLCVATSGFSQMQVDKPIQLTGGTGERSITNLELPVNGTDAVNKNYVDAAVAAAGGGNPTMVSNESATTMNLGAGYRYCNSLSEGGYSDWHLPTYGELAYVVSKGGVTVSNNTSSNYVWVQTPIGYGSTGFVIWSMQLGNGTANAQSISSATSLYVRCVR